MAAPGCHRYTTKAFNMHIQIAYTAEKVCLIVKFILDLQWSRERAAHNIHLEYAY